MVRNFLVAAVMTLSVCTTVRADMCDGLITSVAVQKDGSLYVRSANRGHWLLCSVKQAGTYGGEIVEAESCRSWQAILMAAQKSGTTVRLYTQTATCSSLGDWVQAGVYFVEDLG